MSATGLVRAAARRRRRAAARGRRLRRSGSASSSRRSSLLSLVRVDHRRRRHRLVRRRSRPRSALAVPIALAGLGGLWSERAGVVNIGLEGMMILGTCGAGYFGYHYGPWVGVARRRSSSARSAALLHALATVTFGVDHIVSGVAINILGRRRRRVPRRRVRSPALPGGGPTQSPPLDDAADDRPARRLRPG